MLNIRKYFSAIVLVTIATGLLFPGPGLFLKSYLTYILMAMMSVSLLKVDLKELNLVRNDWYRYILIMFLIFILPTFLVWLLHPFLNMDVYISLIVVASAPSAVAVVFISDLLGGEPSKALVSTTTAHLLSPFLTTLIIWFFLHTTVNISFLEMLFLILKLVILPLIIANFIKRLPQYIKIVPYTLSINTLLLILLLLGIVGPARSLFFLNISQTVLAFGIVLLILMIEIPICFWFGRYKSESVTLAVIGTYKNFTLSSVIALNFFGSNALLGSIVFGVVANMMMLPLELFLDKSKK